MSQQMILHDIIKRMSQFWKSQYKGQQLEDVQTYLKGIEERYNTISRNETESSIDGQSFEEEINKLLKELQDSDFYTEYLKAQDLHLAISNTKAREKNLKCLVMKNLWIISNVEESKESMNDDRLVSSNSGQNCSYPPYLIIILIIDSNSLNIGRNEETKRRY